MRSDDETFTRAEVIGVPFSHNLFFSGATKIEQNADGGKDGADRPSQSSSSSLQYTKSEIEFLEQINLEKLWNKGPRAMPGPSKLSNYRSDSEVQKAEGKLRNEDILFVSESILLDQFKIMGVNCFEIQCMLDH